LRGQFDISKGVKVAFDSLRARFEEIHRLLVRRGPHRAGHFSDVLRVHKPGKFWLLVVVLRLLVQVEHLGRVFEIES
jgi:hypothetical protein